MLKITNSPQQSQDYKSKTSFKALKGKRVFIDGTQGFRKKIAVNKAMKELSKNEGIKSFFEKFDGYLNISALSNSKSPKIFDCLEYRLFYKTPNSETTYSIGLTEHHNPNVNGRASMEQFIKDIKNTKFEDLMKKHDIEKNYREKLAKDSPLWENAYNNSLQFQIKRIEDVNTKPKY